MSSIREARIDDVCAINSLSQYLAYKPVSDDEARDSLEILISSKLDEVWVFEKENKIQGWIHVFCAYRLASAPQVEIGSMVVGPDSRRQGIGIKLVERAKQWASEHNLRLRVRCNTRREATYKFYQSLGFSLTKSQHVLEIS
jgi:N-acetylglutamate synthase-like GNAT family acetyltransferase